MKKIVLALVFSFFCLLLLAQEGPIFIRKTDKQEPYYKNEWYFGFKLITNSSGQLVTYGYIKIHEDGRNEYIWLTQKNFMQQVTGQQPSKANKNNENFLEKHQIRWETFDLLWKLRYSEFPYDTESRQEQGWAGKMFVPSDAQWAFLKENYDYDELTDFIYGDNMWKLLKDIQDPNFASQYSSMK